MAQSQDEKAPQGDQPNHGRMTQDEMEQAIREIRTWMNHMQRVDPRYIMPHPTDPAIDSEGRANLNRAPAAQDTRRRD
jgi:hypothetical protein